ncbi:hypothetical protein [Psychrobacillus sp.]|uniref:hypothetical protein n=1 Tax=Psychrobacillus sp. TaxID=1871623 RepID=UPI0028BD3B46|nr:hypothetical protein [Psychrobacillus sp.]
MYAILGLIGFVGVIVGIILIIINLIKKKDMKTGLIVFGMSFVLFGIALFLTPEETEEVSIDKEKVEVISPVLKKETAEEKLIREAREAEQKVKDETEAKALAEAEIQVVAEKKANAKTIDYPQLKKNPDRYSGEYVKYTGEIIQILEGNNRTNIRLAVTQDSHGYDFNDIIFIEYDGYTDFVDGDIVTIYGGVYGAYSYKSQAGHNISLPGILADEVLSAE